MKPLRRPFLLLFVLLPGVALATVELPRPAVALLKSEVSSALLEPRAEVFDSLLFAELAARPELLLVEREELGAAIDELHFQTAAAASPGGVSRLGHWTGARVLVSARAVAKGRGLTVAARVIGTETGSVIATEIAESDPDRFAAAARELAGKIAAIIAEKSDRLLPPATDEAAELATLRAALKSKPPPFASLTAHETRGADDSRATRSIAAEEIARLWETLGGRISHEDTGSPDAPTPLIRVAARVHPLGRRGELISARAHVSLVVVEPGSGRELFRDRQTEIVLEPSEALALDTALHRAAKTLGLRLLRALPPASQP